MEVEVVMGMGMWVGEGSVQVGEQTGPAWRLRWAALQRSLLNQHEREEQGQAHLRRHRPLSSAAPSGRVTRLIIKERREGGAVLRRLVLGGVGGGVHGACACVH